LILVILGVGLGLSTVSPWSGSGASATAFGISTIVWLAFTQLAASGLGGYLAGRLRTKWAGVHTDEVFFRDTAHGFLAWAVSSLLTAALLTSVSSSILNGGAQAGAAVSGKVLSAGAMSLAAGDAAGETRPRSSQPNANGLPAYYLDSLFRHDAVSNGVTPGGTAGGTAPGKSAPADTMDSSNAKDSAEVGRVFLHDGLTQPLPPDDLHYVGQIVARRTGLSQTDAEKRVTDTYAKAAAELRQAEATVRETADQARKASAYVALWFFVSLLIGAFVSSVAATFGGRLRDA
jgi:hypothetical protein